jgi:hypothetical protein
MKEFQARQGDIFFRVLDKIPTKGLKKKTDGVLALGEVTGHQHALRTPIADCDAYVDENGDIYIRSESEIVVGHDEHDNIILPANKWVCVSRQVEYNPLEKARQRVAD